MLVGAVSNRDDTSYPSSCHCKDYLDLNWDVDFKDNFFIIKQEVIMILCLILFLQNPVFLPYPVDAVLETARDITKAYGFKVYYNNERKVITDWQEIEINKINEYIIEQWFDENPGWTIGRVMVFINLETVDPSHTKAEVNAFFERYGTPSALLLIPPSWSEIPSNGKFEKEILDKITDRLLMKGEK